MSSQAQKLPLSKRWPLVFWFGAAFCFFIFPVFLLDVGLDSMLATRSELHRQAVYRDLNKNLERLLQYANSRHYYHALLKKICDLANSQQDPVRYLRVALANLKARNPDTFRFIVWDKNGASIEDLTDEKGYRYIVKTMFEVFSGVTGDAGKNYPGTPELLDVVGKRLNLLRSYLGAFLIPEKLNLPLLRANLGECVLSSGEADKAYFWYQMGEKVSMLVTISSEAVESGAYLRKLVSSMNKGGGSVRFGITDLLRDGEIICDIEEGLKPELRVGIAKFENFSQQQLETENFLLLVRILNPFVRSFSFISKKDAGLDHAGSHRSTLLTLSALILILAIMMVKYLFRRNQMFSIRWKLALLFIYANGLPLLILGFIGYEYLQQNRRLLLDQAHEQIAGLLTDFDTRYETIKAEYAARLNQSVDGLNKKFGSRPVSESDLEAFYREVVKSSPFDFILADKLGKYALIKLTGQKANNFFSNMSRNLIEFVNISTYTPQVRFREDEETSGARGKIKVETFLAGNTVVFHRFLQRVGQINPEQMGSEGREYYWNMLGDFASRIFNNIMVVSWSFQTLQEAYLNKSIAGLNENFGNIRCFAIVETNGMTYPAGEKIDRSIFSMFRQTFNLSVVRSDEIILDGQSYAAFGTIGKNLSRVAMVGLYPLATINGRINEIRFRLIIFALLSLGLTSGIGWMLSAQFMNPVKELEKGVQAIGRQDFRYRLPVSSADEFGRLSTVFNSAIESLEDLEVAKIVQENLFPQEGLKVNSLQVFGRSVAMTRLGGDYFDFFALDGGKVGILMGDVAGHGVPAALLMAMAKASVLLSEEEKHRPSLMLASLHKVIYRVKSSKIKRMMTCQYFCIDSQSGEYEVSNGGHCFPALIRSRGEDVELLKLIGTPLGITKKPRYEDVSGRLAAGDILLLYTDGIIESQNADGLEMGFDRFAEMLKREYDPDLESYYARIFAGYKNWAAEADDDITMVLIKFGDQQGGGA